MFKTFKLVDYGLGSKCDYRKVTDLQKFLGRLKSLKALKYNAIYDTKCDDS